MENVRGYTAIATLYLLVLSMLLVNKIQSSRSSLTNTFYIRHYFGKCIEYDTTRQVLSFASVCREKFRWHGGTRLIHIPTKMCVSVNATSDGSFLSLSNQCKDTSSLLMYDEGERVIVHLVSGKCLHPDGEEADPLAKMALVLRSGCSSETNKYYFRISAYFIIRHIGGLCWVYSSGHNLMKLQNPIACDRFEYENNDHLRHVETGKCVVFTGGYLRLTEDCSSPQTVYKHNGQSLLQHSVNLCVHPKSGIISPPVGDNLVLWNNGCSDLDRLRFFLYDDKDVLKVKVVSETCLDISGQPCPVAKGHVVVNGHQLSLNTRGINAVLFDYRSGLFEERRSYDVFGSSAARTDLANFLNGLPADKILLLSAKDAVILEINSALALQKIGASATIATTALPTIYASLALIAYTGTIRKRWEMSVNKVGGEGASIVEANIKTFHDRNGMDDCSNELGIRTGKIPDSRFSATSVWYNHLDHKPFQARLHRALPGWCSHRQSPISHYLQVDLGTVKLVSGIAIQAHGLHGVAHFVTKFNIEYSKDGINWKFHKNDASSKTEFRGLGPTTSTDFDTRINWFQNTIVRYLRIIPTARVTSAGISCIRFELYGCAPRIAFFGVYNYKVTPLKLAGTYKTSISVGSVTQKNLTIGISTAADNESLANDVDQMHIFSLNASMTYDNGTALTDFGDIVKVRNNKKKINSAAFVRMEVNNEDYFVVDIDLEKEVLDASLPSGIRWNTLSFEVNQAVVILSKPEQINRQIDDKSFLEFNISHENTEELVDGKSAQLNLSLSHFNKGQFISHANAYAVNIIVYFNSRFLKLKSLKFISINQFSLPPSSNKTKDGIVVIKTDTFWLLNNQNIALELTFASPKEILKGEKCSGEIIIDSTYMNNLARFYGSANNTLTKSVQYKCKIAESKSIVQESVRLSLPEFSMVYDDSNKEVFFCYRKKSYMSRNNHFCYSQIESNLSWKSIPSLAVVLGIDTQKRLLYGVDHMGKSYVRSTYPFTVFYQIEDAEWTAAKTKPPLQQSVSGNLALLPPTVNNSWVLTASGKQLWAATRLGLLKKIEMLWNRVVSWG